MKLARPNVFHPRIVLAVCDGDGDGLVEALRRRGLRARLTPWDDPLTDNADLVILSSLSDFADRREEFLAWTTRVANLLNPPAAVVWNSDVHYLSDLAAAGVSVQQRGGRGTTRQTSLVFLSGEQSHAFGTSTAGNVTAADLDFELWDLGYAALDRACLQAGITRAELLYARVDLTGGTEAPSLRDLDLIAPDLGWRHLDDDTRALQQRRFALGVESACEQLGLGPLSHRGP